VKSPSEIEFVASLLVRLSKHQRLTVAVEPTGTYGDPLRAELAAFGKSQLWLFRQLSQEDAEMALWVTRTLASGSSDGGAAR
jgi:hypothetical protein